MSLSKLLLLWDILLCCSSCHSFQFPNIIFPGTTRMIFQPSQCLESYIFALLCFALSLLCFALSFVESFLLVSRVQAQYRRESPQFVARELRDHQHSTHWSSDFGRPAFETTGSSMHFCVRLGFVHLQESCFRHRRFHSINCRYFWSLVSANACFLEV